MQRHEAQTFGSAGASPATRTNLVCLEPDSGARGFGQGIIRDKKGKSAKDLTIERGHKDMEELLK
jgi:hypothetical protein